ncbi:MAG: ABC transporter ATP-binding protein [Cyanobacteria bacterium P01_G01_bin.38]
MSPNALLLKYALRHYVWIILAIGLNFSGAIFNGVGTTLVIPVLLSIGNSDLMQVDKFPAALRGILNWFSPLPENYRAIAMLGAIAIAIILKNVTNYLGTLANGRLSQSLTRDLRQDGLSILLEVDLDYHYQMSAGDIIHRINDQVSRTAAAIRMMINFVRITFNVLLLAGLLISISWQLTIAATGFMAIVVLLNQKTIKRSREFGRQLAEASKKYSISFIETLAGIHLVRATGNEKREYNKIRQLIINRERAALQSLANSAKIGPTNEIASIFALLFMVLVGRLIFANQPESLGTVLLTYLFILSRLIPFMGQLNSVRSEFANAAASVAIVNDFLARDNKPFMPSGERLYSPLKQGIVFENISFHYPGTAELVLKEINLPLPKGTKLALVGASGAGKSTLADLLPRFYDPTGGRILIDGSDLREFNIESLRARMGIVSQETFLFNAPIRDNIAYARPEATEDEIIDAAKRANAYEFITRLPQGFDTPIGDRGVLLSGGQRQRLSIARALLQDPDILILDEATSALDTLSERLVQKALDDLSRDRTTLVIAHRLSTIQNADQIAVLDKGKVVELGSHYKLLEKQGLYSKLYSMQFQETPQQLINQERNRSLQRASYQMRTRLNSLLGTLQLLADDELIESPEEQQDLTLEAYQDAISLLKAVEELETGTAPSESLNGTPLTKMLSTRLNEYTAKHST